ncbi:MAG: aspartate kinase [Muribaculaceae bacterium]|nr:aspartate kinase [Muribaculaceae bacterium]
MNVLKFGGTSVGSAERIKNVAELISPRGRNIIVLSAMAGTTNTLVQIGEYLAKRNIPGAQDTINNLRAKYDLVLDELFETGRIAGGTRGGAMANAAALSARAEATEAIDRSFDYMRSIVGVDFTETDEKEILAQGELMSTAMMTAYLKMTGVRAVLLPALDFMKTDVNGEPDMRYISTRLRRLLDMKPDADLYITQGFICRNAYGEIDNLQRGGSDYTASLIGAAVNADEVEIWTDIDGMHNNDPRFVEGTTPVSELHFEEAAELAYFGAKILHPSCVLPARLANIPVRLLNTLEPHKPGTVIYNMPATKTIKAVAAKDGITVINIKSGRSLMAYGFLHKVFETFEDHRTAIDMIATSEVGVTVTIDDERRLDAITDDLMKFGTVTVDRDMTIVCVVGDMNWHNNGFEAMAIDALRDIPVRMISYGGSNYNISMVVSSADKVRALNLLSEKLFK